MSELFSNRLAEAISKSPKNQGEIARNAGITAPYLSDLKRGNRDNPSREIVSKLALALNVSVGWLAGESDSPANNNAPLFPDFFGRNAQRDLTLSQARARTERYGQAAAQALAETLMDLRDHLEMLAASGPALSPAAVQACKDRIDAFVLELTRQREQDQSET